MDKEKLIEDIIEIGNITVYEDGKNVSKNFKITRDDQTIIIQAIICTLRKRKVHFLFHLDYMSL